MQVKKQQLELDMKQQNWFQIKKEVGQGCMLSPCLVNLYAEYIMRNARLDEEQSMKSMDFIQSMKLDSRLTGDISVTSDMQMTPPLWQKAKRTKEPLDKGERGE